MKKLVTVLVLVIIAQMLLAEVEFNNGLGFGAGMISGSGFSYRRMNEKSGR